MEVLDVQSEPVDIGCCIDLVGLSLAFTPPVWAQSCVTGTSSAEFQNTGPFVGMWKYTIDASWDTGGGALSHSFDPRAGRPRPQVGAGG